MLTRHLISRRRAAAKVALFAAASALALASAPAAAQHSQHQQHPPAAGKPAAKAPAPRKPVQRRRAAPARKSSPAPAADPAKPGAADHSATDHGAARQPSAEPPVVDHSTMDHGPAPVAAQPPADHSADSPAPAAEHAGHEALKGVFGPYPMQRESSGTAWQPDASGHMGVMVPSGEWTLMGHGLLNLVYDHQSGPRGDDMAFVSGMLMGMARRPLGNGMLQFRAMLSPDPLMGKRGYPLLLASGETANGIDRLIDRQHPHDFFMELSASLSQTIGPKSSLFVYAGLPGEPAFGPPAFMHREAILDSPEAPISHHWLDSTHISFGVLTVGVVLDRVKIDVSRFNAREPDQRRWDIETGPLDSTAVRVSWNPTRTLSLQGSWGHFEDPEQLEPGVDQKRWSASALYADEVAPGWKLAATLAWGRKVIEHDQDDAFVAEASLKHGPWTVFGRGEITENRELVDGPGGHGEAFWVGKVSLGAVRDFPVADHLSFGLGGLFAVNFVSDALAPLYGGNNPVGAMGFVRLKLE